MNDNDGKIIVVILVIPIIIRIISRNFKNTRNHIISNIKNTSYSNRNNNENENNNLKMVMLAI